MCAFTKLDYNVIHFLIGYRGVFKRRTGNKTDGCALYYMSTLLELVEYQTVEFYRPHISPTLLNRPNVAIVARLRSTSKPPRLLGKELIVANTHLLYNPRRSDVRVAQIQILLAEIHKISTYEVFNLTYYTNLNCLTTELCDEQ